MISTRALLRPVTRPLALVLLALLALTFSPISVRAAGDNLLEKRSPWQASGVRHAELLTDRVAGNEGDAWKSTITALFGSGSYVVWDLGSSQPIKAGWLQGDNNDSYEIATSEDGVDFKPVWTAGSAGGAGLRERSNQKLDGRGRYVRIRPLGGDGSFSLSEVQLFPEVPSPFPPKPPRRAGIALEARVSHATVILGAALVVFLLFSSSRLKRWMLVPLWGVAAAAVGYFVYNLLWAWPVSQHEVSLVRGVVAMCAAAAILREAFGPRRFPAHRPAVYGVLAFTAPLAVLAFYNLGHPQFYDVKRASWTPVHFLDLRQYYATAKYFDEIGYRHIYDADMAAYMEDTGLSADSVSNIPMRDLDDHQVKTVGAQRTEVEEVKKRFSPERWEAYKRDARYFREAMGTNHYLEMMYDMGGNATPVWITIAHYLFTWFPASNQSFLLTGLLDPLLVLGALLVIARTFGVRTALACAVVFGANDFIMYGTNWGGATLRHDWMAYIAFGVCAIRAGRNVLGGVLFACATGIRAFPALAVMGLAAPPLWWTVERVVTTRKLPRLAELRAEFKSNERALLGAAVAGALLFAVSTYFTSFEAWRDWLRKVSLLTSEPHGNHISWRSFVGGWNPDQPQVLRERMPAYVASVIAWVLAVLLAARKKRPEQAALLFMILMPILFYPANYYIHFVWLLPLLATEGRHGSERPLAGSDAHVVAALLVMCAAQFFTVAIPDRGLHFYSGSVLLFATLATVLMVILRDDLGAWWNAEPALVLAGAPSVSTLAAVGGATLEERAAPGPGAVPGPGATDDAPSAGADDAQREPNA